MEKEIEIWKDIVGYEGKYRVSNKGRVMSLKNQKLLSVYVNSRYCKIALHTGGIRTLMLAHRLVAINFIPNPENKKEVNHINGIKTDNRVENLEWATHKENIVHSFFTGLQKAIRGERHHTTSIKGEDVLAIRSDKRKQADIAKEYGLSKSTIYKIKAKKSWKHIN